MPMLRIVTGLSPCGPSRAVSALRASIPLRKDSDMADQVRWFEGFGTCRCGCGKPANGILRGPANESYGYYAGRCAQKRINRAEQERAHEAGTAAPRLAQGAR